MIHSGGLLPINYCAIDQSIKTTTNQSTENTTIQSTNNTTSQSTENTNNTMPSSNLILSTTAGASGLLVFCSTIFLVGIVILRKRYKSKQNAKGDGFSKLRSSLLFGWYVTVCVLLYVHVWLIYIYTKTAGCEKRVRPQNARVKKDVKSKVAAKKWP